MGRETPPIVDKRRPAARSPQIVACDARRPGRPVYNIAGGFDAGPPRR
jgi:hypothetical protein